MGLSSKKTTTKGTESSTNTGTNVSTSQVPDWIADPSKLIAGNVGNLLGQGPDSFGPQTSGLQQQAFDAAGKLTRSPYLDQAGDALGAIGDISADQVTGSSLLDGGLDKYYNPFKDQVLNPVLSDFDEQSGLTRAGQAADAARNRAFQGSRYGIQEAQTEGQLARGRASTEGGLLDRMYTSATGLAESDAARRQQAALANQSANLSASSTNQAAAMERARQLAALGISSGAEDRANLGVQAGLGGVLTDQENAARQYPIEFQNQMSGLLSGLNPSLYTGHTVDSSGTSSGTSSSTQTSNPGLLGGLGQIAQIASLFTPAAPFAGLSMSDARVKRDVETLGYDAKGRRWVTFAYIWEPMRRVLGVIAQELLGTDPDAVSVHPSGYLQVDYGRL